jgi:aryl-alcohol dehydrogenase-like predicted oxidoreductase
MPGRSPTVDRRLFLKGSLGMTGAVATLAAGAAARGPAAPTAASSSTAPPRPISLRGGLPTRRFGKTGYVLPVLGHGGSAMVQQWAQGYGVTLGSVEQRVDMVRRGYDRGIRYFDTARVYGESEAIMGRALADVRDDVVIATKVADPRPEKTRESVETSLRELQTSWIDVIQIHSPATERAGYDGAMRVYEQLAKLRDEKLVHYIGLTTHVVFETVHRLIDTGLFDQVLLARGYLNKGMDMMLSNANREWSHRCVARAHELDMAIVIMKVMGLNLLGRGSVAVVADYDAGRRSRLPAAAIRWALQDPRISMLNIGVSVPEDIDANVATLLADTRLTEEDESLLAEYATRVYASEYVQSLRVV